VAARAPALSPCTGVCAIDAAGLCGGCARTLDEIAAWGVMTAGQRQAIMALLPDRRAALAAAAPPR